MKKNMCAQRVLEDHADDNQLEMSSSTRLKKRTHNSKIQRNSDSNDNHVREHNDHHRHHRRHRRRKHRSSKSQRSKPNNENHNPGSTRLPVKDVEIEAAQRRRRRTALVKKMRVRSQQKMVYPRSGHSKRQSVNSCLQRAYKLIENYQSKNENRSHDITTGSNVATTSVLCIKNEQEASPVTNDTVLLSKIVENDCSLTPKHHNISPSTTQKKKTVAREIKDYPDELKALFTTNGNEDFFYSPTKTVSRRLSMMPGLQDSDSDQPPSKEELKTNIIDNHMQSTAINCTVTNTDESRIVNNDDEAVDDMWSATLRESVSLAMRLREMLTDLKTSEAEKGKLRKCLQQLEKDASHKQQEMEKRLQEAIKEKALMASQLKSMARKVEQVEALEREEIMHIKFHSSNAEEKRRQVLFTLETTNNPQMEDKNALSDKDGDIWKRRTFDFAGHQDFDEKGIVFYLGFQHNKNRDLCSTKIGAASTDTCNEKHKAKLPARLWQNPGKTGVLRVTRSSEGGGEAYHALNHYNGIFPCRTFAESMSWFCIDFGVGNRIENPSHYSLRMGPGMNRVHVAWTLEASTDGRKWQCLDERRRVWKMPMPKCSSASVQRRQSKKSLRHIKSEDTNECKGENRNSKMQVDQQQRKRRCSSRQRQRQQQQQQHHHDHQQQQQQQLKFNCNKWHWPAGVHSVHGATSAFATGTWMISKVNHKHSRDELRKQAKDKINAASTSATTHNDGDITAGTVAYRYIRLRSTTGKQTMPINMSSNMKRDSLCSTNINTSNNLHNEDTILNLCGFEIYGVLVSRKEEEDN